MTKRKEAVQRLIKFTHDEFGEHLAALLLGDYGSHQRRLSQIFLISISSKDQHSQLNVEVKTQDQWGLTCGQEPLVMITLLKLLLARREILTGRASYSYQEVLNFLGWRDTKKSRNDIRDSVDINFLQSFNLWVDVSGVHTPMDYLRRLRILTAYEFFTDADESETRSERGLYRGDFSIDFNLDFIRSLRERSLLGLDWNLVIEVTRIHELESLSEEPI